MRNANRWLFLGAPLAVSRPEMHVIGVTAPSRMSDLPGSDLVERGLLDLGRGVESAEALLVSMAAPRLRALGFDVPTPITEPELRLYRKSRSGST